MTLVRKGKICSSTYHRVYAVTLWLVSAAVGWRWWVGGAASIIHMVSALSVTVIIRARMMWRVSAAVLWTLHVLLVFAVPWAPLSAGWWAVLLIRWLAIDALRYSPLFLTLSQPMGANQE